MSCMSGYKYDIRCVHGGLAQGVNVSIQAAQCLQGLFTHFDSYRRYIVRKFISILILGVALAASAAQAAEPAKAAAPAAAATAAAPVATPAAPAPAVEKTPQQSKMAICNKDADGKKGDERKAFMKNCLSAKPEAAAAPQATQQNKMKTCNADAAGKKGDERKAFMSECLKK